MNITLRRASRGLAVGKTGSGKSTLALAMIPAMPLPVLCVDTKYSRSISDAAAVHGWEIVEELPKRLEDRIVWRPAPDQLADPYAMDAELDRLVRTHAICSVYIDELYQLHANGRAGPGIIGLWTRGRELGFTTLASTQRPAWVSQFCLTESDQYYLFTLTLKDDRKKLSECLGNPEIADNILKKHWFWYVEQGNDAVLCQPLALPKELPQKDLTEGTELAIPSDNEFIFPKLIR